MKLELKEQIEKYSIQYEEMEVVEELGNARDFVEGVATGLTIVGTVAGLVTLT